jgi:hypothetical protein
MADFCRMAWPSWPAWAVAVVAERMTSAIAGTMCLMVLPVVCVISFVVGEVEAQPRGGGGSMVR